MSLYGKVGQAPQVADKLTLTGVLCTDNPATRKFPVKILFIVDSSGEMSDAAPNGEHIEAMNQVISQYLPIDNVFIGAIRYDSEATSLITEVNGRLTTYYTRDDALIDGALANLRNGIGGQRDLLSAMSLARSIITGDAFQSDLGPLSRTKYVVVHIYNGSPQPTILSSRCTGYDPPPAVCEPAFLEQQVRDIRDLVLGLGAAEFSFHSIHLEQPHVEGDPCDPRGSTCTAPYVCRQTGVRLDIGRCVELCDPSAAIPCSTASEICATTDLLDGTTIDYCARDELNCFDGVDNDGDGNDRDCSDPTYPYGCTGGNNCEAACRSSCRAERIGLGMALATGGRYERFASSDQLNMGKIDFRSTQRLFVLKEFLAFNRNAQPSLTGFIPDSDADGLSDIEENKLGLDPLNPDTDNDYYNDKLEHILRTLNMDPLSTSTVADCDDPTIDTDGDGLRDCEEKLLASDRTLFDTDADGFPDNIEFKMETNILFNDGLEDIDLDGVNNGREIRAHTDPTTNDARVRSEFAYRYRTTETGVTQDQRSCYDFRVSNITLLDTLDRGYGTGFNYIDVYFGQVPDGALESFGIIHVAQVPVQFLPPDRRVPDTPAIDLKEGDFVLFEQ